MVRADLSLADESPPVRLVHIATVPYAFQFLQGQVGYMKARGFEVHAISSPGELLDEFSQREQVPVYAVPMFRRITPLRDLLALFRLWRLLRRLKPAIVHTHTPKGGLLGLIASWLARGPVRIYHLHGLRFVTTTGYKRCLLRWAEKAACRLAHQIICVSHSLREVAIDHSLCSPEKLSVLLEGSANGVDAVGRFNPAHLGEVVRRQTRHNYGIPSEALVIGFVGRVVRDKGMVELAEAWQTLCEEFPTLHLLLIGPLEDENPIPQHVWNLLLSHPRIHLTGFNADTPPLYAAMDVLVLPSYREGFPVAVLEAAAMKLPVVATRIPGCIDAVQDGVTGTLLPPHDVESLTIALQRYLKDPELRCKHGAAGRESVLHNFRPELIWEALYQKYIALLRERYFFSSNGDEG